MTDQTYRRPDKVIVYLYRRVPPGKLEYLLLQRSPESKTGCIWQTVVGSVRWDEELVEAARREVFEEIGLTRLQGIMAIGYAFSFPVRVPAGDTNAYSPDATTIRNTVFVAEVVSTRPIRLSHEHIAQGWFCFAKAMDLIHWPEEREALAQIDPMLVAAQSSASPHTEQA